MKADIEAALAFERDYALGCSVTVEWLRERGRVVAPCNCGEGLCRGWQSIPRTVLDSYQAMGRIAGDWSWPPAESAADGVAP